MPDHVCFKLLEQTNVRTQIFQGLPRDSDHHAGTDLISALFKPLQALETMLQMFGLLVRNVMKKIKKFVIRAFKACEITKILAVAAGFRPFFVDFFRLISETQGNAETIQKAL